MLHHAIWIGGNGVGPRLWRIRIELAGVAKTHRKNPVNGLPDGRFHLLLNAQEGIPAWNAVGINPVSRVDIEQPFFNAADPCRQGEGITQLDQPVILVKLGPLEELNEKIHLRVGTIPFAGDGVNILYRKNMGDANPRGIVEPDCLEKAETVQRVPHIRLAGPASDIVQIAQDKSGLRVQPGMMPGDRLRRARREPRMPDPGTRIQGVRLANQEFRLPAGGYFHEGIGIGENAGRRITVFILLPRLQRQGPFRINFGR